MVIKYGEIVNHESGLCNVGIGDDIAFYKSIGFVELDVQQSDKDGFWYLTEKCPTLTENEKRIILIDEELNKIQLQLNELDLKSIRALREGGENADGVPYLEYYQNQINELRLQYANLVSEKLTLEGGSNDIFE